MAARGYGRLRHDHTARQSTIRVRWIEHKRRCIEHGLLIRRYKRMDTVHAHRTAAAVPHGRRDQYKHGDGVWWADDK
jgi:hypothetical protein